MKTKIVLFFAAVLLAGFLSATYGAEQSVCPREPAFQKEVCGFYLDARRLLEGRAEVYLLDTDTKTSLHLYWGEGELVLERSNHGQEFFRRGYYFDSKSIIARWLLPFTRTGNGTHPVFEPRGPSEALRFSELEEIHEFLRRARETIPGKNTPL